MEVMKITEWGLLVIVISLAIITFNQLRLYTVEQAYRRAKRKIQRDKNSKYIEILELQVSQLEERLSCVETSLHNRGK
tara:strand:+ start:4122 stop:4355 length:234 start_codon:yes stop_codon:yes gene_type:complete